MPGNTNSAEMIRKASAEEEGAATRRGLVITE
jgi:hypothetical protein